MLVDVFNTYMHSVSKSDFFDKKDNPENSENLDNFSVHCPNAPKPHSSILTYLHSAEGKQNIIK